MIKKVSVEMCDKKTRFVLKNIKTPHWECFNRKMAVTNQIFSYEEQREKFSKPLFCSPFQTWHIRWDGRSRCWDFEGMNTAKTAAQNTDRIFVAQRQMNQTLWGELTKKQAFNQYEELVNLGLPVPTMNIPKGIDLPSFKKINGDATSILSGAQQFMPIFSSKHDFLVFPDIIHKAVSGLQLVGLQLYGLCDPVEFLNLSALRKASSLLREGEDTSLVFGFNHPRHMNKYSHVNSAFAYSCFGVDVFSERQCFLVNMPKKTVRAMMKRGPEEFMLFDVTEGGFNTVEEQEGFQERNLTRTILQLIPVEEGLNPYQALVWCNMSNQNKCFTSINMKLLLEADLVDYINNKSRWATFYGEIKSRI